MEKKFAIGEVVSCGWEKFKKNIWLLGGLALIDLVISSIPNRAVHEYGSRANGISLITWLIEIVIQIGVVTIALKIVDGKKTGMEDLFENIRLYFRYLSGTILYGFIVFIGFLLLIVPGVIWAIKYQFYGYLIIDKKMGPTEALRKSGEITEGVKWDLFGLGLLLVGVIILGAIALGVGLLAAIPVVWLSTACVYRKLSKKSSAVKEEPAAA